MESFTATIWICLIPSLVYSVEPSHEDRSYPGVVTSPRFPRPYPKGSQYSWKFERTYGTWAVVFEELDIEQTDRCKDDYLLIRDPVINADLSRTCGNVLPEPVYSTGSKLLISFHSDQLNNGKGFKVRVYHDYTQDALKARLAHKPTTVQIEQADSAEVRLSRDDLLIYSLSLALLVAVLVLICLGGWTVYHHCYRDGQKSCCGCSGKSGNRDTVITMEPVKASCPGKKYSKPRLKEPQPGVTDSNNVYLPMPDHDKVDQSQSSSLGGRTRTDARGSGQLPQYHTSHSGQFEDVKFIGVM